MEPAETSVVEFKGRMLMVTVLHVREQHLDKVNQTIIQHLEDSQSWLKDVALVLDFPPESDEIFIHEVVSMVRLHGLNLIAVSSASQIPEEVLIPLELGVVMMSGGRTTPKASAKPATVEAIETVLIETPIRSGQQIYSRGDLIVMNSVGTGAELMAEGHIHVYGNLRGRALAGVRGDVNARIFCQRLNAELVSVAGHYQVAENLPQNLQNEAVKVSLNGENLTIDRLNA